jgi:magnesium-transporting ATPase (P-type)
MIINLFMCVSLAIAHYLVVIPWTGYISQYFGLVDDNTLSTAGLVFVTYYILFSWMIPISLYITVELVKLGQAQFMEWDLDFFWKNPDDRSPNAVARGMTVKTSALNEELGCVDYVFSDKTGTLTNNKMDLSLVSAGGKVFKDEANADELDFQEKANNKANSFLAEAANTLATAHLDVDVNAMSNADNGITPTKIASDYDRIKQSSETLSVLVQRALVFGLPYIQQGKQKQDGSASDDSNSNSHSSSSSSSSAGNDKSSKRKAEDIKRQFFFILDCLLCNSVIPEENNGQYIFLSQSPDEIALLQSLDRVGVTMCKRAGDDITVNFKAMPARNGIPAVSACSLVFKVAATLEFTSARRRSDNVILLPNGKRIILVKGADSSIFPLCDTRSSFGKDYCRLTEEHANTFAQIGSRTLVMAGKELTSEEWNDWYQSYEKASRSLEEREDEIEKAFFSLESNMDVYGCSAVNDQLQPGVPDTIDALLEAGIKVIVLTGDKRETAVTIAKESHVVQPHMQLLYLQGGGDASMDPKLQIEKCHESLDLVLKHMKAVEDGHVGFFDVVSRPSGEQPSLAASVNTFNAMNSDNTYTHQGEVLQQNPFANRGSVINMSIDLPPDTYASNSRASSVSQRRDRVGSTEDGIEMQSVRRNTSGRRYSLSGSAVSDPSSSPDSLGKILRRSSIAKGTID